MIDIDKGAVSVLISNGGYESLNAKVHRMTFGMWSFAAGRSLRGY